MRFWAVYLISFWGLIMAAYAQDSVAYYLQSEEVVVRGQRIFSRNTAGEKVYRLDTVLLSVNKNLPLSELLIQNSPLFIRNYGRGQLASASFRGTSPSHTQVVWNGLSLNSPLFGMTDLSLVPSFFADRITVHNGVGTLSSNQSSLGGAVRLETVPMFHKRREFQSLSSVGSFSTFGQFLRGLIGNDKFQSVTHLFSDWSKNDYPFLNYQLLVKDNEGNLTKHPTQRFRHAGYAKKGLLQSFYGKLNSHSVNLHYWVQGSDRNLPTLLSVENEEGEVNKSSLQNSSHRAVLFYGFDRNGRSLEVSTGINYEEIAYQFLTYVGGNKQIAPSIHSVNRSQSFYNALKGSFPVFYNHTVAVSAYVNYFHVQYRQSRYGKEQKNEGKERYQFAAAMSYSVPLQRNIDLKLTARGEATEGKVHPFATSLGGHFFLNNNRNYLLKINVFQNIRVPTLNDLYLTPNGNPNLKTEVGRGGGFGIWIKDFYNLSMEGTFFVQNVADWIIWLPSRQGFWTPRNVKKVATHGVEVNVNHFLQWGNSWQWKGNMNYSYTRSINYGDPIGWGDASIGKQLVFIPIHKGNFMGHLGWKGWGATYVFIYTGEMFSMSSNERSGVGVLDDAFVNHFYFQKKFRVKRLKSLVLQFKVYNFLNSRLFSLAAVPLPQRHFEMSLKVVL